MANHGISEKKIERFVITETISTVLTRMLERAWADSKHTQAKRPFPIIKIHATGVRTFGTQRGVL